MCFAPFVAFLDLIDYPDSTLKIQDRKLANLLYENIHYTRNELALSVRISIISMTSPPPPTLHHLLKAESADGPVNNDTDLPCKLTQVDSEKPLNG